jgi:MFS family permease
MDSLTQLSSHEKNYNELGIRANLYQFLTQLLLVFFVGIIIGLERNIIPLIASEEFGIGSVTVIMSFVISFGVVKGLLNLYGGHLSEKYGRKNILIIGWLFALPIPILIIFAWEWWIIVFANILLGINQGLAWSMTVTSKIDIVGKKWRGLAIGMNEWAGYTGVALATLIGGYLASVRLFPTILPDSIRVAPFMFGMVIILLANLVSIVFAKETINYALNESKVNNSTNAIVFSKVPFSTVFKETTFSNKTLFATSQAGLIEKFVDVTVWVAFPLYFATLNMPIEEMALIVAVYGFSWGFLQLVTGPLSDIIGRKPLVVSGLVLSGLGISIIVLVDGILMWLATSLVIGAGMAMLYPTLLAVVSDVADPSWRATSLGVYRMWRDGGFAIGALIIGVTIDLINIKSGFFITTFFMLISAVIVLLFMKETK